MPANETEELAPEGSAEDAGAVRAPDRIRDIPGTAGHGVARAYGYIALAAAYGAEAELVEGSTRTGRGMLRVAVYATPEAADEIDRMYAALAPAAEDAAGERRAQARKDDRMPAGYDVNRMTRAVLAGFLAGAAGVLKTDDALKVPAYKTGSRARVVDDPSYRAGVRLGKQYAEKNLRQEPQEAAAV